MPLVPRPIWVSFFLFIAAGICTPQTSGYGDPSANYPGSPSWRERAVLTLTNACRMDPVGYRDQYVGPYSILLPQNYPAQNPVYWNIDLNRAARFHAVEMADSCGLRHISCDSTAWNDRVKSYYTKSATLAENIATGYSSPQQTVRQWLLDSIPSTASIAADKSGNDGHRANIMNVKYRELGAGYDSGAVKWYHFWVQDFGGGKPDVYPIPAGSHLFLESGKTTFMANYFDSLGQPPAEASVTVEGQTSPLTLVLGADARGSYAVALPKAAGCRHYFFSFRDGRGVAWRFPAGGMLVTFGEGGCDSQYAGPQIAVESAASRGSGGLLSLQPNPAGGIVRLSFPVESAGLRVLEIWDAVGKRRATLVNGRFEPGLYAVDWTPARFTPGIYFAVLRAGNRAQTQKIALVR